jgi:hypothetical protein
MIEVNIPPLHHRTLDLSELYVVLRLDDKKLNYTDLGKIQLFAPYYKLVFSVGTIPLFKEILHELENYKEEETECKLSQKRVTLEEISEPGMIFTDSEFYLEKRFPDHIIRHI